LAAETGHTATVEALLAANAKFTQNEVRTPLLHPLTAIRTAIRL